MVRPLRLRHHRIAVALGVVLPFLFIVGILARKPVPSVTFLPFEPAAPPSSSAQTVWHRSDLFGKTAIQVRLLRENNSGRFALELSAPKEFVKPDLIVYWLDGNSHFAETVPADAQLLGSFNSPRLQIPETAATNGMLVLYSLADQKLIAASEAFATQ